MTHVELNRDEMIKLIRGEKVSNISGIELSLSTYVQNALIDTKVIDVFDPIKYFHVDDLETERIQYLDFGAYKSYRGAFHIPVRDSEFRKLKRVGGIHGGNNRNYNVKLAETIISILKSGALEKGLGE